MAYGAEPWPETFLFGSHSHAESWLNGHVGKNVSGAKQNHYMLQLIG